MKQVMLIFRKDVRYLWREMAVYVAVLMCFAVMKPQTWPGRPEPEQFVSMFVTVLQILIGLSMVVLITRAVHADNPAGDSQFWVTRPYRWSAVLVAKALFVVVCVAAPFVLMQWVLLWTAGLGLFSSAHALMLTMLCFVLGVWVPLMLAASVTESLGAMIMFVVGLLLAWAATLQFVMAHTESRMSPRHEFVVMSPLFAVLMVGILMYQYAKRRTRRSQVAIVCVMGLVLLMAFGVDRAGFGAPIRRVIDAQYPVPNDGTMKLVFGTNPIPYEERQQDIDMRLDGGIELRLPMRLVGLSDDARIREPHVAFDVTGVDGAYSSHWQDAKVSEDTVEFVVPRAVYEWMAQGKAAEFRVQLSAEELRLARTSQVTVANRFRGPNGGVCEDSSGFVVCRFAYEQSVPTRVILRSTSQACTTHTAAAEVGTQPWLVFPVGGRTDPVVQEPVKPMDERDVCPGDVLTFSEYALEKTFRLMVDVPVQGIAAYRVRPD